MVTGFILINTVAVLTLGYILYGLYLEAKRFKSEGVSQLSEYFSWVIVFIIALLSSIILGFSIMTAIEIGVL